MLGLKSHVHIQTILRLDRIQEIHQNVDKQNKKSEYQNKTKTDRYRYVTSPRWAVRKRNIKLTTPPHLCVIVPYKYRWGSAGSFSFCLLIVAVRNVCVLHGALGRLFGRNKLTGVGFCGSLCVALRESWWDEYTAISPWRGLCFNTNSPEVSPLIVNSLIGKWREKKRIGE